MNDSESESKMQPVRLESDGLIEKDLGELGKVRHKPGVDPVPMMPIERATLTGLIAAREAVMREIEGYLTGQICARLGIHRNRILNADVGTGIITFASDAPKPVQAPPE